MPIIRLLIISALIISGISHSAVAQRRGTAASEGDVTSVTDPELLSLHKEFVSKAERLAAEYERKKNLDGAREVYEAMTRLIPEYESAQAGLKRILTAQSTQDRKIVDVKANLDWQNTTIDLVKGNPVRIEVKGSWFVVNESSAEGIEIPKEMDPKNPKIKLGTLIGMIVTGADPKKLKPFPIGNGTEFIAPESGRLALKMFDIDPTDNKGSVTVMIQSTFAR